MSGARALDRRASRAGLAWIRPSGNAPHPASPTPSRVAGGLSEALRVVTQSAGKPLDPAARAGFEARFGHDFGRIRIHASGEAESAADRLERARLHARRRHRLWPRAICASFRRRGRAHRARTDARHSAEGETSADDAIGRGGRSVRPARGRSRAVRGGDQECAQSGCSAGVAPAEIQRQPKPEAAPRPIR